MNKQTDYDERRKQLTKARTDFDHTVQDVADQLGYSKRRIYHVLKYPNENPDLFKEISEYVQSAGYPFEDSEKENLTTAKQ
ncbi:hypothetical protein [Fodinibius sp.]|uniref:hypothetical protein n=1 Tax=Fodinibius sp. TaxID=1872440 RepID=UPI002ACE6240|nr:hypothetical protein [Fodinibius sp.]MDZ7658027.1 hypothetical protein [Fodinibius sp.]